MSQANLPGGLVVQYTYNGDGLKIRRIEGSAVTRYYHDGFRPIYETDSAGSLKAQLERDIFGNLLARKTTSATYYYHHDGLGSTTGLTNASGQVVAQRTYDAWGNLRTSSGSAPGNYQFTGAELDPASGLYHMGARFYDTTIGRWLSEDPVQDKQFEPATLNLYAFVNNNPLIYTDPDGRTPLVLFAGVGALLGLAVYAGASGGQMTLQGALLAAGLGALAGIGVGSLAAAASTAVAAQAGTLAAAVQTSITKYGVLAYNQAQKITAGLGHVLEAHHIIPARFAGLFGVSAKNMPSVVLSYDDHQAIEAAIRGLLKPGVQYTKDQVIAALIKVYAVYAPQLVRYVHLFAQQYMD